MRRTDTLKPPSSKTLAATPDATELVAAGVAIGAKFLSDKGILSSGTGQENPHLQEGKRGAEIAAKQKELAEILDGTAEGSEKQTEGLGRRSDCPKNDSYPETTDKGVVEVNYDEDLIKTTKVIIQDSTPLGPDTTPPTTSGPSGLATQIFDPNRLTFLPTISGSDRVALASLSGLILTSMCAYYIYSRCINITTQAVPQESQGNRISAEMAVLPQTNGPEAGAGPIVPEMLEPSATIAPRNVNPEPLSNSESPPPRMP